MYQDLVTSKLLNAPLLIWACCTLASCNNTKDNDTLETATPTTETEVIWAFSTIQSPSGNDGFGTSLATSNDIVFIGAPHGDGGGAVYQYNNADGIELIIQGEPNSALGASLAFHDGHLYTSAPLHLSGSGMISRIDGTSALGESGDLLGKRLYSTGGRLFGSSTSGLFQVTPPAFGKVIQKLSIEYVSNDSRIGGLVARGDELYIGTPYGDSSVSIGQNSLSRTQQLDEAGYSLCLSDLNGDSIEELVVGAPGKNRVEIYGRSDQDVFELINTIDGNSGRFGHSVSCVGGVLIVGAPLFGEEQEGAIWRFEGDPTTWVASEPFTEGSKAMSQLGFDTLLTADGRIYAGAPGGGDTMGAVLVYAPATL